MYILSSILNLTLILSVIGLLYSDWIGIICIMAGINL